MMDFKRKRKKQEEKNDSTGVFLLLDFSGKVFVSFEALCERVVRFKYNLEALASPPG